MPARIPLARPEFDLDEESLVKDVLHRGTLLQGPMVQQLEQNLAHRLNAPYVVAVNSGTSALYLALGTRELRPRDEVLCPSFSFVASANPILHHRARPVFCDVERETGNVSVETLEQARTPRTKGVVLVHQLGLPCDTDAIAQWAQVHGLWIVEDAACALGASVRQKPVGSRKDTVCCLSFHPRNHVTTGEGGAIVTHDPQLERQLRSLRSHGMEMNLEAGPTQDIVPLRFSAAGHNLRLTDLQAAVGVAQLRKLDRFLLERREIAARYHQAFSDMPWLLVPADAAWGAHTFQSYLLLVDEGAPVSRDLLIRALRDQNVQVVPAMQPIHREPYLVDEYREVNLPQTQWLAQHGLLLPLYPGLLPVEQDRVINCIQEMCLRAASTRRR